MDNQHRMISGYRELDEYEIEQMNQCKQLARLCGDLIDVLENMESTDKRAVAIAKTKLQEGFMWAVRSVAKPTTF